MNRTFDVLIRVAVVGMVLSAIAWVAFIFQWWSIDDKLSDEALSVMTRQYIALGCLMGSAVFGKVCCAIAIDVELRRLKQLNRRSATPPAAGREG